MHRNKEREKKTDDNQIFAYETKFGCELFWERARATLCKNWNLSFKIHCLHKKKFSPHAKSKQMKQSKPKSDQKRRKRFIRVDGLFAI